MTICLPSPPGSYDSDQRRTNPIARSDRVCKAARRTSHCPPAILSSRMPASRPPPPPVNSESWSRPTNVNSNTIVPPGFRDVRAELAAALSRESRAIADYFDAELPVHAKLAARVALLNAEGVVLHELPASPEEYLVVGRHTEAAVRVGDALSLSLRHVLLIPQRAQARSGVVLDVVALAPTMRIASWPEPMPQTLAGRCTPLVLGDALLLVAPMISDEHLPEVVIAPDPESQLAAAPRSRALPREERGGERRDSRISTAIPADSLPEGEELAADAKLVLEVRDDEASVRIGLREPWLVGGIVIGRNTEKCSHASLARVLGSDEVSRCHLYVRREQDEIVFYDTASTSGVRLGEDDEEYIRRVAVPAPLGEVAAVDRDAINPERTQLWLSTDVRLTIYSRSAIAK